MSERDIPRPKNTLSPTDFSVSPKNTRRRFSADVELCRQEEHKKRTRQEILVHIGKHK
jgi:hypothetical protein